MSVFKLEGTIYRIEDTEFISDKFSKREFVLLTNDEKYPQHILCQLTNDNCDIIENFNMLDQIEITFSIRGREWVNNEGIPKYFNTINVFKIEQK